MTDLIEARPGLVTAEMRRAVPEAAYPCAAKWCEWCHPSVGYVLGKWYCAECLSGSERDQIVLGHWSEDESEWIEDAEVSYPWDKLPPARYACSWGDCGEDCTWLAGELRYVDWVGAALPDTGVKRHGFYCPEHFKRARQPGQIFLAYYPTLAEVLDVLAGLEATT